MRPVLIELKREPEIYEIVIGHGILKDLGVRLKAMCIGSTAIIVTNPVIKRHHEGPLVAGLKENGFEVDVIEVPAGEPSKSSEIAFQLIHQIAQKHASKDVFFVAFGGGVVGDLTGYVAAAYKRGVPYVQVPTTFLAQIDSAIGGKVAIDLPFGKNLVGAFYQPRLVYTDIAVLSTLDERQIQAGMAEAIKYGVICDKGLFALIKQNLEILLKLDQKVLNEVVMQCSRIKAGIVSRDEKEDRGIRTILNFGHTAGHAVEAACEYEEYNHGEAVALGMRIAGEISLQMGFVKEPAVEQMNELLTRAGLPQTIKKISLDKILNRIQHDKKFKSGKNRFVLMMDIGSVKVQQGIDKKVIRAAINKYVEPQDPPTPQTSSFWA